MRCKYFKKTKIKCPPEKECLLCPLREKKTGDCIKDIHEDASEKAEERTSEIWRRFYEGKNTTKDKNRRALGKDIL